MSDRFQWVGWIATVAAFALAIVLGLVAVPYKYGWVFAFGLICGLAVGAIALAFFRRGRAKERSEAAAAVALPTENREDTAARLSMEIRHLTEEAYDAKDRSVIQRALGQRLMENDHRSDSALRKIADASKWESIANEKRRLAEAKQWALDRFKGEMDL